MGFIEWAEEMRKKPIAERRRFVAVTTIAVMAVIALIWFVFFFFGLQHTTVTAPAEKFSIPEIPALDPAIEKGLEQLGL